MKILAIEIRKLLRKDMLATYGLRFVLHIFFLFSFFSILAAALKMA